MTSPVCKSILFSRRDVALMLRIADFFNSDFAREMGEEDSDAIEICADLIAEGCPPSQALLDRFNLRRAPGGFQWIPQ